VQEGGASPGFANLQADINEKKKLEQKMLRIERRLKKANRALRRKHGLSSTRTSEIDVANLPPPSWRPLDPEYVMNSPGVSPLLSSGYGNTARFRTQTDVSIAYSANAPERVRFAEIEEIIDNSMSNNIVGPHKKKAAEFTVFAEAASRLGINLSATGHGTDAYELH
jgi:hypothetical protein